MGVGFSVPMYRMSRRFLQPSLAENWTSAGSLAKDAGVRIVKLAKVRYQFDKSKSGVCPRENASSFSSAFTCSLDE